ncbi:alpha/beta hydrolase [Neorhizobium sp. P12A]|uniref:alpha/beta fold hydrolase n=1 Tax=Neorhizobium sp. P12A TaxID=2268027 RepID=UPI0011EE19B9|nr:alpha/beta hydrolase [Neorhizobium sp. P12A]KAA0695546.1 alpha/beta hydrolase [Neorhizobium sp. P12A]
MDIVERTIHTSHGAVRISDTEGAGFPVFMIHGSSWSRKIFEKQLKSPLADAWRLIAVDLPGHGDSDNAENPLSTYSIAGLADCMDEVIEQLAIPRLAVLGWSLGGHVAIQMASRSTNIAGLMLSGAPPVPRGLIGMLRGFHPSFDMLLASKPHFSERDRDRFEHLCFGTTNEPSFRELIMRADGRARARFAQSMMRGEGADQRRTAEQASVPIAFVEGSDDPFVRASYIAGLNVPLLFGNAPQIIQGAGHAPFWEKPDEFNALLHRFLQDVMANEAAISRSARRIVQS